ncbi:MAG: ABC transporter permease [Thermodesulfobacteriota bacterium]
MFRLVTRHKIGLLNPVPASYENKISNLDGVSAITSFLIFGGTYIDDSAKNFFPRIAVEPESFLKVFDDATLIEGSLKEWINDASGSIVGEELIKKYGWEIGDQIVLKGNAYPVNLQLTIRGVYGVKNGRNSALFFNRKYLEEALPSIKGKVGTIWIKASDVDSATRLATQIDELFENSPYPTRTESEKAFQMGIVSMLGNVKLLIISMGVIIVIVIILIAANTIAITSRERTREIAVLRILGFTRWMILLLIIGESIIVSSIGGLVGIIIFVTTFNPLKVLLATTPVSELAKSLNFFPETIFLAVVLSTLVGILSAIIPAIGSSRRKITEGIRHAG